MTGAVQVARGRGSLEVLAGAETCVSGFGLMGDLDRLMVAMRVAEETCALIPEGEPIPEAFDAAKTSLDLLMNRAKPEWVGPWFESALPEIAGYRPELDLRGLRQSTVGRRRRIFD